MEAASSLLGVQFQDLLPKQAPIQDEVSRHLSLDSEGHPDEVDPALAFWRSCRPTEAPLPSGSAMPGEPLDYFISHLWQPPVSADCDGRESHVKEKLALLKAFAAQRATLASRSKSRPWFLTARINSHAEDPINAWRTWRCWVDKACAPAGVEAVRTTQAAVGSCKFFLAVVTHAAYFSRLWCVFEWSLFMVRAAPHYRQTHIAIADSLFEPSAWRCLLEAAAGFNLASLRSHGEGTHPEVWKQLEQLLVSDPGFEAFIRATALALLAYQAMVALSTRSAAFSAKLMEPLSEVCMAAGLHGLAKALTTARPRDWWRIAYKKAQNVEQHEEKEDEEEEVEEEDAQEEGYMQRPKNKDRGIAEDDDPLERLGRLLEAKFKLAQAQPESERDGQKQCTPGQAAKFAMRMQEVKEKIMVTTVLEFKKDPKLVVVEDSEAEEEEDEDKEKEEEEWGERDCLSRVSSEQKADSPTLSASPVASNHASAAPPEVPGQTAPPQTAQSSTLHDVMAAFKGIPEDFHLYERGINGENLLPQDKDRAQVFHRAWKIYRQRVGKWFDVNIVPQLEVWRQRGIRIRSMTEEAFDTTLVKLSVLVQDELSEAVAPGFHEASLAREQPPRGRPKVLPHAPWAIPALDRLVTISRKANSSHATKDLSFETDMARRPAILMSSLPLQVGTEPSSAVLCVRTPQLLDWRRACTPQALGARALVNGVGQLLANYQPGNQDPQGIELEVIVPRIVLKVLGTQGEVVCGLRIAGRLQSPSDDRASVDAQDVEDETSDADWPSGRMLSEGRLCQKDRRVSLHKWHITASEALTENTMVQKVLPSLARPQSVQAARPTSPKTPITVLSSPRALRRATGDKSTTTVFFPRQRPQSKLWPGMERAERLLPAGAESLPPKLPSIRELRGWQAASDAERGLVRSWRCSSPRALNKGVQLEETPMMPGNAADFSAPDSWSPRSSRSQLHSHHAESSLRDIGSTALSKQLAISKKLQCKQWSWLAHIEGSPAKASFTEERFGNFYDHFQHLYRDVLGSCFTHWVPVTSAAFRQDRPMTSGCYAGGGGGLIPSKPQTSNADTVTRGRNHASSESTPAHPLAMSSFCEVCGKKALARVPLDGSLMENIWGIPACVACISCGFVDSSGKNDSARLLDEDCVLEVTTALLVRPSMVGKVQQLIQRVLRLKQGQCAVAIVREMDMERRPTRAISRVASASFVASHVAVVAASAILEKHSQAQAGGNRSQCGPFAADHNWISETLNGTGLDLEFDHMRKISVDQALEDLDDKRMLPLRQEMSPLLLWVELKYVLSADFDLIAWNMSLSKIYGNIPLAAAIIMRMNIAKLREAVGAGPMKEPDGAIKQLPAPGIRAWPLALHRIIVTKATEEQSIMSAAVKGAGLQADSVAGLLHRGVQKHSEQLRKLELWKPSRDIEKDINSIDVDQVMQVVIKTQSILSNSNRAILQARRILKRKQVFTFLRKLHDVVTSKHDDSWTKVGLNGDAQKDGNQEEDEEEEVSFDSDDSSGEENEDEGHADDPIAGQLRDEDLLIHAPPKKNGAVEEGGNRAEALTIVKVLGHFREYIHYTQMTLMSVQVISVIVATVSKFVSNELFAAFANARRQLVAVANNKTSDVVEKTILDQDFINTACRALYRHHAHQEICHEVLALMKHLLQADAYHGMNTRATEELLKRNEGISTVFVALGNMCLHGHRDNVLSSLQVLVLLADTDRRRRGDKVLRGSSPCEPSIGPGESTPLKLAAHRFDEIARITVTVLSHYWDDEAVVTLLLPLVDLLCDDALLRRAVFVCDIATELRKMLLFMATGDMSKKWFEDAKVRTGMKLVGPSGRGLRKLKDMTDARMRVNASCSQAEIACWRLLGMLCLSSACNLSPDMKADGRHISDAKKSIAQALQEMRRNPRTAQWHLALEFLKEVLVRNLRPFLHFFVEEGGLKMLLKELSSGQVKAILPLVLATLDAVNCAIPEAQQSHIGSDVGDDDYDDGTQVLRGSKSTALAQSSRGGNWRPKSRAHTVPADMVLAHGASPEDATLDGIQLHDLLREVKVIYSRNGATSLVLSTLVSVHDEDVQNDCLRILAELFQDSQAGSEAAVQDFMHFHDGGPQTISRFLSLENEDRTIMIVYALEGAMAIDEGAIAAEIGETRKTIKVLIQMAWKWIRHRDIRRRVLRILRAIVNLQPEAVSEIAGVWETMKIEYEKCHVIRRRESKRKSSIPAFPLDLQAMDEVVAVSVSKEPKEVEEPQDLANAKRLSLSFSVCSGAGSEDELPARRAPKEMRHFWAMLRVHRYKINISSAEDIHQVVSAMEEFTADMEICGVGIEGLMSGADTDLLPRYPVIGSFEDFDRVLKIVAQLSQDATVVYQLMRMLSGVLDSLGAAAKAYLQPLVLAILKVLYVKISWSSTEWEALLFAISTSLQHGGKSQMIELDAVPKFEESWDRLKAKEDDLAKMVVSSYREQTEALLRSLG